MAATYHTIENIQALLTSAQIIISDDSDPDETTIGGWMDETEAKVEAALKDRYTLPPTGSKALLMLAEICAKFTAARVWNAVFGGQTEPGQRTYGELLYRQAQDLLNALAAGDIAFPDEEPLIDPAIGPGSPAAVGMDRDSVFTMEDVF